MFQKILIANRGEIALRIIRACRELGIRTVAIYSQADAEALHAQLADEAMPFIRVWILSENSKFADMCRKCGITFIGPSAEVIERMGNKPKPENTMIKPASRLCREPKDHSPMPGKQKRRQIRLAIRS